MSTIDLSYNAELCELTIHNGRESHQFTYEWGWLPSDPDIVVLGVGDNRPTESDRFTPLAITFFETYCNMLRHADAPDAADVALNRMRFLIQEGKVKV
ncbi:MAG: hypothetical protein IID33_14510 [Planctomycetes bacterium]|nr:hypothetical protein [Planctomycetota bacterium]